MMKTRLVWSSLFVSSMLLLLRLLLLGLCASQKAVTTKYNQQVDYNKNSNWRLTLKTKRKTYVCAVWLDQSMWCCFCLWYQLLLLLLFVRFIGCKKSQQEKRTNKTTDNEYAGDAEVDDVNVDRRRTPYNRRRTLTAETGDNKQAMYDVCFVVVVPFFSFTSPDCCKYTHAFTRHNQPNRPTNRPKKIQIIYAKRNNTDTTTTK